MLWLPIQSVFAGVIINEIMYDVEGTDTDREWIEIKNDGSESIDIASWKFFEANSNHGLVLSSGDSMIGPGEYAIIAAQPTAFLVDWPSVTAAIFDSSFSLNNETGEALALKNGSGEIMDEITYSSSSGAAGNGNSLNRSGDNFVEGDATPGDENTDSSDDTEDEEDEEDTETTTSGSSTKKTEVVIVPKLSLSIEAPTIATVGVPIIIDATMRGYEKEGYRVGHFMWGMGDGYGFESESISKFWYIFEYPGEYVITLDFAFKKKEDKPDASARAVVVVTEPKIIISGINTKGPGSLEIKNISNREVELSKWIVRSGIQEFSIANNTILLPGRTLILNPKVTQLSYISSASLIVPTGQIVSSYPIAIIQPKQIAISRTQPSRVSTNTVSKEYIPIQNPEIALSASATGSVSEISNNTLWYIIGLLTIASSILGFLYIRKMRREAHSEVDDFEITE
jgi:hypothetical protein